MQYQCKRFSPLSPLSFTCSLPLPVSPSFFFILFPLSLSYQPLFLLLSLYLVISCSLSLSFYSFSFKICALCALHSLPFEFISLSLPVHFIIPFSLPHLFSLYTSQFYFYSCLYTYNQHPNVGACGLERRIIYYFLPFLLPPFSFRSHSRLRTHVGGYLCCGRSADSRSMNEAANEAPKQGIDSLVYIRGSGIGSHCAGVE